MSVLVTGASGFTGGALCRRLRGEGRRVVAFVRATSDVDRLEDLGVECRVVELTDARNVRDAFEPFDEVYHLAAAYRVEHADRGEFRRVNVEGTRNLLEAAMEVRPGRFVHCSTVGVQGAIEEPPADETYRVAPGDHYQESKLEGERVARAAFARGLPGSVVRPVGIYGPGDRRFLKLFRAIARGRFVMIGNGRTLYHMTYIEDVVDGLVLAARSPRALGEIFNVAGEKATTLAELVATVASALGRTPPRVRIPLAPVAVAATVCEKVCLAVGVAPPLYPRRVDFFRDDRSFSIEKAKRVLGYRPKVSLADGVRRTAAAYREAGWL